MHFRKVPPKIISYRDFYLQHTLSQESRDWSKNPDKFYEICHTIFNTHAPKKKMYIRWNNNPFMTKAYSNATMQRARFRNKFLKNPNGQIKLLYNKHRNYCASPLRKEKKEYLRLRILCKIK